MDNCCHSSSSHRPSANLTDHNKHQGHDAQTFLNKFWFSLILTIPVVLYADVMKNIFNWSPPIFIGSEYLSLALGSTVFFYGGWVFLTGAWKEMKARLPGMMTLIGLAIVSAYLWSVYAVFAGEETLFWELTTLITVMLFGHWMEMRAVSGAQSALKELSRLLPDTAEVIRPSKLGDEVTITLSLGELVVGDILLVKPGSRVPADGKIIEGNSEINESLVTGESKPVSKSVGDEIIAGSTNGDGALKVEVTKIGEHTFLSGVMRLVAEAQVSKSRLQKLSDKAALYLTGIAVVGGIITFVTWLTVGATVAFAVARVVAVLVIACPHALGLAVPLVASISTTKAAKNGCLIKQRLALESARNVDVILFDKTGTLTEGKFSVTGFSSDETLSLAATIEAHSEHPIASAIVTEARKRNLEIKEAKNFRRIPGVGAEALVEGKKIFVGHRDSADIKVEADNRALGNIIVSDTVRVEAREALNALKDMRLNIIMITGDSEEVAKEVSAELGINEYFARVKPEEKIEKVKLLQSKGLKVAMVGDGVNDAPALMQADLGIAIGAGTNVAIESAGIILVKNDPRDIVKIIRLSRMTYSKMIQNLFWATGYNVVAIPLAAGVLISKGIVLEPAVAAILMSVSTVVVAVNASLLAIRKL
ncbi:MAG: copper-translocating P-type ATPase [Patescibacteria group bacterium]